MSTPTEHFLAAGMSVHSPCHSNVQSSLLIYKLSPKLLYRSERWALALHLLLSDSLCRALHLILSDSLHDILPLRSFCPGNPLKRDVPLSSPAFSPFRMPWGLPPPPSSFALLGFGASQEIDRNGKCRIFWIQLCIEIFKKLFSTYCKL